MTFTTEEKAIAFWAYLIDTLTPEELKEALLIIMSSKPYKIKSSKRQSE